VNIDLVVEMERAPLQGETLIAKSTRFMPGGKGGNQAAAAARYGADTVLFGCVGDDPFGSICEDFLRKSDVDLNYLKKRRSAPTGTAIVVLEQDGNNRIIVSPGANALLKQCDLLGVKVEPHDVLLAQLEVPAATVAHFMKMGAAVGAATMLNVSPAAVLDRELLRLPAMLIFNLSEFELHSGSCVANLGSVDAIAKIAVSLTTGTGQATVITLGADGALLVQRDEWKHIPARRAKVIDTTGAGDCFAGVLAAAIAEGVPLYEAAEIAGAASAVCIGRLGAGPAMPTRNEILSAINEEATA
jgi:ribokinase